MGKRKKLKENNNCFSSCLVSKINSYLTHVETIPVILRDLLLCVCSNDQLFVIHLGHNTCFLDYAQAMPKYLALSIALFLLFLNIKAVRNTCCLFSHVVSNLSSTAMFPHTNEFSVPS